MKISFLAQWVLGRSSESLPSFIIVNGQLQLKVSFFLPVLGNA